MKTYLFVYLSSLVMAIVITPIVIYIARRLKIYDRPGIRKVHTTAIPRIGGAAIFLSATMPVLMIMLLKNHIGESLRSIQVQMIALSISGTFIFLAGFIDDLYGIRARHKLLAQIIAATIMCSAGIRITSLNFANLFVLDFGWLAFPITIFWMVAITNAVNLIDGLDGLAAGISAVSCAVIAVFAFSNGQALMVVLMLALLGSLSGFLFFNFNPARIFMGDCGSMFLGFVLASASVMCAMKSGTIVALALPAIALGLPIFDTIFSMIRRYLGRRGIMSPDRNHLHHILLDMGLHHSHVVIFMYGLTILAAAMGMFMMLASDIGAIAIFFCVLLLLVLVFRAVGAVRMEGIVEALKRRLTISRQERQEKEEIEKVELYFHEARAFDRWWEAVCFAADKMDFIKGSLPLINRDGTERILSWQKVIPDRKEDEVVKVAVPIRDRRAGLPLKLELDVKSNGSIESVGRRIALFGRLIEEYGIVNLPKKSRERISVSSRQSQDGRLELQTELR